MARQGTRTADRTKRRAMAGSVEDDGIPAAPWEGAAALHPLVGLAREDLLGAAAMLVRETLGQPRRTLKVGQELARDAAAILANKSDLAPSPKDKRFQDPAWTGNPIFRMGMQSYLATQRRLREWVGALELEPLERARAAFVMDMILDALAPTNALATNPSALKRAFETGGRSLVNGLRNAFDDLVHHDMIVSQVDRRPFKVGENLAVQPGAVVHRSEMMELLQYAPTTAQVHEIPLVIIPPQINKAYLNDLTPEKSLVKFLLGEGLQVFLVSWRNPGPEHGDWGLNAYVDELGKALEVVREITGAPQVHVSGACSGGITTATLLSKLTAQGRDVVRSGTFQVCVLDPRREDTEFGPFLSQHGIELARRRSAAKGVLAGSSLKRTFSWLRPNDLVWSYVVANYLHGENPAAFDILFWNDDATNLPAALHSDYLRLLEESPFTHPGERELAGHALDLGKVDIDLFFLAGITDHITPWKACYRSSRLFGSRNAEFVLSQAGHIQALLNPPGNPKAKYFRMDGPLPDSVDDWTAQAEQTNGSWWPHWSAWLKARSGAAAAAPDSLGSPAHPPLAAAPGSYVLG